MPQITIGNHPCDLDTFSIEACAQLTSLQAQTAVLYSKTLQAALPVLPAVDTMNQLK